MSIIYKSTLNTVTLGHFLSKYLTPKGILKGPLQEVGPERGRLGIQEDITVNTGEDVKSAAAALYVIKRH